MKNKIFTILFSVSLILSCTIIYLNPNNLSLILFNKLEIISNSYNFIIIYFLIFIFAIALNLPFGAIMILLSSYFFGFYKGYILSYISIILGSTIYYYLFNNYDNSQLINKIKKIGLEEKLIKLSKIKIFKNIFLNLLIIRIFPIFPLFLVNSFCILIKCSFKYYIISLMLGINISLMIINTIGTSLKYLITSNL